MPRQIEFHEAGMEITVINGLLGHRSLKATSNCLRERLSQIRSPLSFIAEPAAG